MQRNYLYCFAITSTGKYSQTSKVPLYEFLNTVRLNFRKIVITFSTFLLKFFDSRNHPKRQKVPLWKFSILRQKNSSKNYDTLLTLEVFRYQNHQKPPILADFFYETKSFHPLFCKTHIHGLWKFSRPTNSANLPEASKGAHTNFSVLWYYETESFRHFLW